MGVSFKMRKRREIGKETPMTPVFIAAHAQERPQGALVVDLFVWYEKPFRITKTDHCI
jgi:hypothetical protein